MKLISFLPKQCIAALAAVIIFTSAIAHGQQPQTTQENRSAVGPFNLLVLGDSILWGQGLDEEHKSWYQVRAWLEQNSSRSVSARVEAHSGAVIGSSSEKPGDDLPVLDGEINRARPSINEELDAALKTYSDPTAVDLVLVNGCINDVSAVNLLNGANKVEEVKAVTTAKCGPPVQELLTRITRTFPHAHVVVTGYYPIISERTPDSLLMRAVGRIFYRPAPQAPKLKSKEIRQNLIAISNAWYEASNNALAEAVHNTNQDLSARGSRQRVQFAKIPFPPEYAFSAKETRLWGFSASFLKKLLAALTLGKVRLKTDDERRKERVAICDQVFKPLSGDPQKKQILQNRLLCHYASIGHPNRKGAAVYTEAIVGKLKALIEEIGWLRDARAPAPIASPN